MLLIKRPICLNLRFMAEPTLLRPKTAAQMLAVSRSTIYRWFWEGNLKGIQITGGTIRIFEASVREKLAAFY